jgi:hypothetical protein
LVGNKRISPPRIYQTGAAPLARDLDCHSLWYRHVYDLAGTKLGEVADPLVNHEGKNTAVLIWVGGFLGAGETYVAVPFDAVHFRKKDNSWYPVINTTKDTLKNAPGYRYDRTTQTWRPENAPASVGDRTPQYCVSKVRIISTHQSTSS